MAVRIAASFPAAATAPAAPVPAVPASAPAPAAAPAAPAASAPTPAEGPHGEPHLGSLRQVALFLEKINLAEWVAIMNDPRRSFWVNFWAGVARGIGMIVGAALAGIIFAFFSVGLLKKAFVHAGGVPWVGSEMRTAIGFVLKVLREAQGGR